MTTKTFLLVFITFFCGFMAGAAMMQLKVTKQTPRTTDYGSLQYILTPIIF